MSIVNNGIAVAIHAGQILVITSDGKPIFGLSPQAADLFAAELINAAALCRGEKKPIDDTPKIVVTHE